MVRFKKLIFRVIFFTYVVACKEKPKIEVLEPTKEHSSIEIEKVTERFGTQHRIHFGKISSSFSLVEVELCQKSGSSCSFNRVDIANTEEPFRLAGLDEGDYRLKINGCISGRLNSVVRSYDCSQMIHESGIVQGSYTDPRQIDFNRFYNWAQKMKGNYHKFNYINSVSLYNRMKSCGEKYGSNPEDDPFFQELSDLVREYELRVVKSHQEKFSDTGAGLALADGESESVTQPVGQDKKIKQMLPAFMENKAAAGYRKVYLLRMSSQTKVSFDASTFAIMDHPVAGPVLVNTIGTAAFLEDAAYSFTTGIPRDVNFDLSVPSWFSTGSNVTKLALGANERYALLIPPEGQAIDIKSGSLPEGTLYFNPPHMTGSLAKDLAWASNMEVSELREMSTDSVKKIQSGLLNRAELQIFTQVEDLLNGVELRYRALMMSELVEKIPGDIAEKEKFIKMIMNKDRVDDFGLGDRLKKKISSIPGLKHSFSDFRSVDLATKSNFHTYKFQMLQYENVLGSWMGSRFQDDQIVDISKKIDSDLKSKMVESLNDLNSAFSKPVPASKVQMIETGLGNLLFKGGAEREIDAFLKFNLSDLKLDEEEVRKVTEFVHQKLNGVADKHMDDILRKNLPGFLRDDQFLELSKVMKDTYKGFFFQGTLQDVKKYITLRQFAPYSSDMVERLSKLEIEIKLTDYYKSRGMTLPKGWEIFADEIYKSRVMTNEAVDFLHYAASEYNVVTKNSFDIVKTSLDEVPTIRKEESGLKKFFRGLYHRFLDPKKTATFVNSLGGAARKHQRKVVSFEATTAKGLRDLTSIFSSELEQEVAKMNFGIQIELESVAQDDQGNQLKKQLSGYINMLTVDGQHRIGKVKISKISSDQYSITAKSDLSGSPSFGDKLAGKKVTMVSSEGNPRLFKTLDYAVRALSLYEGDTKNEREFKSCYYGDARKFELYHIKNENRVFHLNQGLSVFEKVLSDQ